MGKDYSYIDIVKYFGKQDYLICNKDYKKELLKHPLVNAMWTVGRCFSIISNTNTWKAEMILGDCKGVTGYDEEDFRDNAQFILQLVHSDDMPFVLEALKIGMQYINSISPNQREKMFVTYFTRSLRKDGRVIIIQNQTIPLVFDARGVPFIFSNITSDITFLKPANIPHALIINRFTDEQFHIDPNHLELEAYSSKFTVREKELIRLLIQGFSSREIAEKMSISYETVRKHRSNILQKTNLKSTQQLISYVMMNEWI